MLQLIFKLITYIGLAYANPSTSAGIPFSFALPQYQTNVKGFITEEGGVRISHESQIVEPEALLFALRYSRSNPAEFEQVCDGFLKVPVSDTRADKNFFRVLVPVYPYARSLQKMILNALVRMGERVNPAEHFENSFNLEKFDVEITIERGSLSSKVKYNFSQIAHNLSDQLQSQIDQISQTGGAAIDLSGLHVLACDLIHGKAHLLFAPRLTPELSSPTFALQIRPTFKLNLGRN